MGGYDCIDHGVGGFLFSVLDNIMILLMFGS
jgi:hypothetical protein